MSSQLSLHFHNCCKKILALIVTGVTHPRGSNNFATHARIDRFVVGVTEGNDTLNRKESRDGFQLVQD